jgi:nucleoside diphosphate kinase
LPSDPSLRRLHRDGDWRALTAVPDKFRHFSVESPFRESWNAAETIFGDDTLTALQRVAVLTVKPDGVITRAAPDCLSFMSDHGFRPIGGRIFHYDRTTSREIWRYQWNIATLDRLQVADAIHRCAPALMMFFEDETRGEERTLPATVRLAGLKGPAKPAERTAGHLRSRLAAVNRMIVAVHCSDEPIDIVRELGILFGTDPLTEIYAELRQALGTDQTGPVRAAMEQVHRQAEPGHRSIEAALKEFDLAVTRHTPGTDTEALAVKQVETAIDDARRGIDLKWREWSRDLHASGVPLNQWTAAFLGAQFIRPDIPGATCVIDESGRERWLTGQGRLIDARG